MRVTTQGLFVQVSNNLQQAYRRVAAAQETVTTGVRINRISDDPFGSVRVLGLRNFASSLNQYQKNIDTLQPVLDQTDAVLSEAEQSLMRAKELALASANDTQSASDRASTADEIHQLYDEVLNIANTKVDNRYLFAGFANQTAPFSVTGGVATYAGDSGVLKIQTSSVGYIDLNLPGDQVFQGAGITGGTDILDVFAKLETALKANNVTGLDGIQTQLGRIDGGIDQILGFRAQLGSRINNAQGATNALDALKIQTEAQRSQIEDADPLKAYSEFARYQQAFQAALSSAAQVVKPSLLDFLN